MYSAEWLDAVAARGGDTVVLPVGADGLVDMDAARGAILPWRTRRCWQHAILSPWRQ